MAEAVPITIVEEAIEEVIPVALLAHTVVAVVCKSVHVVVPSVSDLVVVTLELKVNEVTLMLLVFSVPEDRATIPVEVKASCWVYVPPGPL